MFVYPFSNVGYIQHTTTYARSCWISKIHVSNVLFIRNGATWFAVSQHTKINMDWHNSCMLSILLRYVRYWKWIVYYFIVRLEGTLKRRKFVCGINWYYTISNIMKSIHITEVRYTILNVQYGVRSIYRSLTWVQTHTKTPLHFSLLSEI